MTVHSSTEASRRGAVRVIASAAEALAAARELAAVWATTAVDVDARRRIPRAELEALSRSGLLAITVPREFGGAGVSVETLIDVILILAVVDVALTQIPQNHFDFVNTLTYGAPETRAFFYREVLHGARFGNAIAEPGRASRRDLATTIVEEGAGYRIKGKKYFSTGALTAQWVPVHARHADGRIRTAYVRRDNPNMDVQSDWDAFGQRGTYSGTTLLNDVWVPRDHVVDRSRGDPAVLTAQFAGNQLIHAAIETGAAEGAIRDVSAILGEAFSEREAPERDLARLGELAVRTKASRALVKRAARRVDVALEAAPPNAEASLAAAIAVDEAKSLAYEIGPAVTNEVAHFATPVIGAGRRGLDRLWRNSRTHSLHDPVRWRQFYVGDFHLNGRLSPDLAAMINGTASAATPDKTAKEIS